MPRFQPLGEELLSAAAPPRGGRAASSGRADGVSQGRARGAQHCAGEARSLRPELGFAEAEGGDAGGGKKRREEWGLGERGWGGILEAQSGGEGEGRARLLPGGEWVQPAPSSRAGRRTRRIQNPERGGRGRPGGRGGVQGGRAGAQREEAASALPGSASGEFLIQASRAPSPSPGLPAPTRAPGVRGRLGLCCASQLGSGGLIFLLAGGLRPGAPVRGSTRPGSNFAGPQSFLSRALGSELCAGGNGGALGTARYPPAGSPGWGMPVPGDRCTCPSSTLRLPRCPTLRPNRNCEPQVMAESLALPAVRGWGPEAGRAPLPEPRSGLASNFARSLLALSSRGHGGAARTSHFFRLDEIGV